MQLFEQMEKEHHRLSSKITNLEHAISSLPQGNLGWQKRGENYRYYCLTDTKQYLSRKKDYALIEELGKKKYLQKMLSDDKHELTSIEQYLKKHRKESLAKRLLTDNPHLSEILTPLFRSPKKELAEWAAKDYPSTAGHPEQLIFPGPCALH